MASEKRRLGRGLGALIPAAAESDSNVKEIDISLIQANPYQPRANFDPDKLQELADSIREHGIVQALVVAPSEEGYTLVAGERRFRAAQLAGLSKVPAVVRHYDQSEMLEIALIENLQREDLNPVEEAMAYRRLIDEFGFTQEKLANRIGKSRSAVANTLRLLMLPDSIREALCKGAITAGQVRPLLGITDQKLQQELGEIIMERGLTAREAERLVAGYQKKSISPKEVKKKVKIMPATDPVTEEVLLLLQRHLGTRVKIKHGEKNSCIEIYFYGEEDLERLVALLLPGELN
ncbi:MAG: ParB/RepB/Spo0J family partition protein [Firmicutes bacterium]|jgi:ParB family chromosome partitioning protein|nr:ParB/RepB/Spo0J family partition protein [Bacillota bacterium]